MFLVCFSRCISRSCVFLVYVSRSCFSLLFFSFVLLVCVSWFVCLVRVSCLCFLVYVSRSCLTSMISKTTFSIILATVAYFVLICLTTGATTAVNFKIPRTPSPRPAVSFLSTKRCREKIHAAIWFLVCADRSTTTEGHGDSGIGLEVTVRARG